MKTWYRYFAYSFSVLLFMMVFERVLRSLRSPFSSMGSDAPFWSATLFIISIVFGLLLGTEYFVTEFRKKGEWKINVSKLIFFGIPSLMFSTFFYLYYSGAQLTFYFNLLNTGYQYLLSSAYVYSLAQIILGYSIATSFYKK